jgi:tartrate-resistant acid phosphatase type 5
MMAASIRRNAITVNNGSFGGTMSSSRWQVPSRRDVLKAGAGAALTLPLLGKSALADAAELPFLVLGDWGRDGAYKQRDVADQMGKAATANGGRFVLAVGDNFYEDGVQSVDDPHFRASFEDVYTAESLQTPWYAIAGNHDYHGNVDAQIAYSGKSTRWHMPARYYTRSEALAAGGVADFFFLDTSPFVTHYLGSKTKIDGQDPKAQLAWFEAALKQSTARWKIVSAHHPVFSGGSDHGNTAELIRDVKPLLERYGVTAYFFGHDHDLQHIVVNGVNYFGCGAGAETRPTSMIDGSRFASDHPGFFSGQIAGDTLRFTFIDYTGATIYQGESPVRA